MRQQRARTRCGARGGAPGTGTDAHADLDAALLSTLRPIELDAPETVILRQVRRAVADGHLGAGGALPPERELARRLDVTRGTVRRALDRLHAAGLLVKQPQSGSHLGAVPRATILGVIDLMCAARPARVRMILDALEMVEAQAAEALARAPGRVDGGELAAALAAGEEARGRGDAEGVAAAALSLHALVVSLLRNPVLQLFVQQHGAELRAFLADRLAAEPGRAAEMARRHAAMAEAVRRGDADGLRAALGREIAALRALLGGPGAADARNDGAGGAPATPDERGAKTPNPPHPNSGRTA